MKKSYDEPTLNVLHLDIDDDLTSSNENLSGFIGDYTEGVEDW